VRVLFLTADYPPLTWSGIGTTVAYQAQALSASGHEVHVLCSRHPAGTTLTSEGPKVHYLQRHAFPLRPNTGDLVYIHSVSLAELAIELAARWKLPLLYMAHSLLHKELTGNEARQWVRAQRMLLLRADHVFFPCEGERQAGLLLCRSLESRSSVLRQGIPASSIRYWHSSAGGPVVFAGRYCFSKGIDTLMEVAVELLRRNRSRQFVIAGGHGNQKETAAVYDMVQRFPQNCSVPGWLSREALDDLFFRASLVLVPSRYEPFGMVALEALRMGAPVLGTATGGLAGILTEQSGGKSMPCHDPVQWANEAESILDGENNTGKQREQRSNYVAAKYNLFQTARDFLSCVMQYA
jgi:glycosyltransferase involved in cell wall biosynthesis